MIRRVRDAILLDLAVVYGWHLLTSAVRFWLSWTAPRPVIEESALVRLLDELVRSS